MSPASTLLQRFIMYDRRAGASFPGSSNKNNNNVVVAPVAPGRTSTLVLTNVRAEDSGKFICVAENRAGTAEANFTLQVSQSTGNFSVR